MKIERYAFEKLTKFFSLFSLKILWKKEQLDWVQTVRNCKMGLDKSVIAKLLERRWEFQQDSNIPHNLKKMVDEMKALIMN